MRMNLKDRIIKKLLSVGKKHRILVYPTLALVAIISAISHAVYWGRGNGKKLVASAMVMVMLITQSIFLTSSADVMSDEPETGAEETATGENPDAGIATIAEDYTNYTITYYRVDEEGVSHLVHSGSTVQLKAGEDGAEIEDYHIVPLDSDTLINKMFTDEPDQVNHITIDGFYLDQGCTASIGDGTLQSTWIATNSSYNIYFKATRNSYPLEIVDSKGNIAIITDTIPADVETGNIYPTATYTVKTATDYNYYMTGYKFAGLKFYETSYVEGAPITLTDEYKISRLSMAGQWQAMEAEVSFDAIGDGAPSDAAIKDGGDEIRKFKFTYGSMQMLPTVSQFWGISDAYTLSGWQYTDPASGTATTFSIETEVDTTLLFDPVTDMKLEPNIAGRQLVALWAYKNIHLTATEDGVVSSDGTTVNISGQYGDEIYTKIEAKYNDNTSSTFSYDISQTDIDTLGSYGLGVKDAGTYFLVEGQLSKTTPADGISVTLVVTDEKAVDDPATTDKDERVSQYVINFVANKKEVTVDVSTVKDITGTQSPYMTYNGTTSIAVNPRIELTGVVEFADTGKDNVFLQVDNTAILDSADAGYNKNIVLTGVKLAGDVDKLDNYIVTGISSTHTNLSVNGVATVYQRPVTVGLKLAEGKSSTVLFGEEAPQYMVYLTNPNQLPDAEIEIYNGLLTDADKHSYIVNKLGPVEFKTDRRLYSDTGDYAISAAFNGTGKNYCIASDSQGTTFTVARDAGIKYEEATISTANFRLSTEKSSNGYYPGLNISAYGDKYDRIRMFTNSNQDLYPTMSKDEVAALFVASSVDIPDMVDGTIYIQMYSTSTGAVTETVTISNLSVDTSGPNLEKYSVSPDYLYFNKLPFGSYFHSQTLPDGRYIESLSITFEYSSEGSYPDSLFYSFVDDEGNIVGNNSNQIVLTQDPLNTKMYKATVTIHPGEYGQLVVYATDETGNKSVINKVKLEECVEYIKENPVADGYYEWMVENTIESSVIEATSDGATAVSDIWYNDLNLKVDAIDTESGVSSIKWVITGPEGVVTEVTQNAESNLAVLATGYGKVLEYTFEYLINDPSLDAGEYTIYAVLKDNAWNTAKLDEVGSFLIDTKKPVITDNTAYTDEYINKITLDFTAVEGEDESGIASVKLYKQDGSSQALITSWEISDAYTYELNEQGTYIIEAIDKAGNVSTHEIVLEKVSSVKPFDPVIGISGTTGNDDWYIEDQPEITITSSETTTDGVPVTTYYNIITEDREREYDFNTATDTFSLKYEGPITIEAWAVSASGVKSDVVTKQFSVDLDAPEINIVESSTDDKGKITVRFKIVDEVSGVDIDKVYVNGKQIEVVVEEDAVTGTFDATTGDMYEITAEDYAGNVAESIEFKPLTIKVNPVVDITETGAYLEAFVYEGTYDIADSYIAFKKDGDTSYSSCLHNKTETSYGVHLDTQFNNLEEDTVYWYKIYATTKTSNEVKVYEGSFKTTNPNATGSVTGTVTYGDGADKDYPVYVSLYEANTVIATDVLEDENDTTYLFENVNDGIYRVVATNGVLTKTAAVTVENGGITYPSDYAENGGINFILNSMSTTVVIEDNAINITADGLEKIYDTTWYEGIITPEDKAILADGGSINVSLHASYINVSDVSPEEQSIFNTKLGKDAIIERYIQIYIVKEVKDKDGKYVNGTPSYVPELYDPITIAFPLGDLAGKKVYVASVHSAGSDYSFINWNDSSKVDLSKNYVTITTNHFSVYALYTTVEVQKEYTVKWIDGDGNVMKTEVVLEGEAATPPTEVPTKTATDKYVYTFSGWDTDYSSIEKDTIIAAWFTAKEKDSNTNDNPQPPASDDTPGDEDDKSNEPDNDTTTEDDKEPGSNNGDYTYMGSAGSPNTGDATPVMLLLVMMIISSAGIITLKKLNKE